jgi:hypothetical protein
MGALGGGPSGGGASRQTSKSQSPANPDSVHSAVPSQGVKVGIESRHRQPQRALRASSTKAEEEEEEEEEEPTAELSDSDKTGSRFI